MKRILTLSFTLLSIFAFGQIQQNAPWAKDINWQEKAKSITLQEVSEAAEAYFKTIDIDKKGSGYKPFKRWEYQQSFYTNEDGTFKTREDLLKSWEEKRQRNYENRMVDVSDWQALGPFSNSNTFSANNQKQTGQGRINAIAVDPSDSNTFYVGTPAGGLWKSTDAGLNWTPLTDDLPQIGVSGIAIHPTNSNIIYIATGDDDATDSSAIGVWKSTDGGLSWNNTGNIPGNPTSMNEIYIHPTNHDTVLVATSSGVQKTTNGGSTWITKRTGNIKDIKMKPNDPTVWYAITSNAFYRSTDSGETFSTVAIGNLTNSGNLAMDVTAANPNYVYIVSSTSGGTFNGVFKSTNSGASFSRTNQAAILFNNQQAAWYDLALTVSSANADIVYIGVVDLYKSTNGGDNFTKINDWANPNTPSYTHADIHFLRFMDGKFFAGTDGGIFISTDEGVSFTDYTKNLAISQFYRISVSPTNSQVLNGGLQDNGGYGLSGGDWRNYHGGDGMEGLVDPTDENRFYGFMQFGQNLFISSNGGRSLGGFVARPAGEGGRWVTPLQINNQGELFAGFRQIYKLNGTTWSQVSNHGFFGTIHHIEIDPNNSDNIYASRFGTLYKSTDGGSTFTNIQLSFGNINSIEIHSTDSNIGWVVTNSGVYQSNNLNDATPTFSALNTGIPSEGKIVIKHHSRSGNNTLYLGTTLGVYYYNDDTNTWDDFDNNLPNTAVRDLAINEEDAKLIAATYGRGIFVTDIPEQLPPNDVKLESINNPTGDINCGSTITPEITIKNNGTQDITSVTINYNVDGGTSQTQTWTGSLASEATTSISLNTINSLTVGAHSLNIETTITDDTYASNNNKTVSFFINELNTNPTTVNTFENTTTDALLNTTNNSDVWEVGTVNKSLILTTSNAYATKLTGNYADETTGFLYTNCYDLTTMTDPVLTFKMAFDIENEYDYLLMQYSTDQGQNWQILGSATDPNWYTNSATVTAQGASLPGAQWTGLGEATNPQGGTNATMHDYSYDLGGFTNEASIIFRFVFFTDQNTNEEGVVIDDLVIQGTLSTDSFDLLSNIAIYPNPSDAIFNIDWNTGDTLNIKVFDVTGKQVFAKKNIQDTSYQLDLNGYAQGIYFLNMNMNGKTATKKLIKR